jgi:DNA-binding MurR/RpiR family transcriptional regulator
MKLLEQIKNRSEKLSGKQAVIGKFIVDNLNDLSILNMNISTIACKTAVSEATVTRFVYALGYRNFADFQLAVQEHIQEHYAGRSFFIEQGNGNQEQPYSKVFSLEVKLMEETLSRIDPPTFDACIDLIFKAKKLLLVGCSPNDYLVNYMQTFLGIYHDNLVPITSLGLLPQNAVIAASRENCAAVVFSYPRYPTATQKIVQQLHEKKIPIMGLTDSELSPIMPFCQHAIITPHKYLIVTDPMASVMAVIHSLIYAVFKRDGNGSRARLHRYETVARGMDTFVNSEFNFAREIK